ncbi:glycosyltransferase family 4 protein [Stutzerimonas stutzeri]|uniref:glycosyltransferase family 4 protein n=1 Tax=Stutzerimonas stutzeri TaxID=316 RepID=UPI00222FD0C8|nr:glycosyltransferase family 4 protein [Stutzerimonas stutzeri]
MKIAYVITRSDALGGASVHLLDLAQGMLRLGHDVVVLVGGTGTVTDRLQQDGIPYRSLTHLVRPFKPVSDIRALAELRQVFAEVRPDVVHLHSSKAGTIGRLAAISLGLPSIFTAHGWAFTEGVPLARRLVYWAIELLTAPLAERIITVSEFDRQLALRMRVGTAAKMQVIHNAVPDRPRPCLPARETTAPVRLMMVARFEAPKDQATLLRALAQIESQDWQLDLIGNGPELHASRLLASTLGLDRHIRFLGDCRNVGELLEEADIFVLCSLWEGLPLSIIEAMRAGLPVVATRVGGVPELVAEGHTGLLAAAGNIESLRSALLTLMQNREARQRMGVAGRMRYENHFRLDRMLDETLTVYSSVIQHRT